mmetsp:Transcript_2113/g.7664  ORF Transcript_2113/g.7664 Transcript_2113/m.7664 type:complete len:590 (-) Transcript_2113:271-2040(-)
MRLGREHQGGVQGVFAQRNVIHVLCLSSDLELSRRVGDGLANDVLALLVVEQLDPVARRPGVGVCRGDLVVLNRGDVLLAGPEGLRVRDELQGGSDKELEEEGRNEGPPELDHPAGGVRRDVELLLEKLKGFEKGLPVPLPADQGLLGLGSHHRLGRHAAIRECDVLHDPVGSLPRKLDPHPRADDGDVVLPAVRLLELLDILKLSGARELHLIQDLVVPQVNLPVPEEEVLGLDAPLLRGVAPRHHKGGAAAHPQRVEVADGASRHDVARDGGHVLDLVASKPLELIHDRLEGRGLVGFDAAGREFCEELSHARQGHTGAEGHRPLLLAELGPDELRDPHGRHQGLVVAVLELDLDPDLRVAAHQLGLGAVLPLQVQKRLHGERTVPCCPTARHRQGVPALPQGPGALLELEGKDWLARRGGGLGPVPVRGHPVPVPILLAGASAAPTPAAPASVLCSAVLRSAARADVVALVVALGEVPEGLQDRAIPGAPAQVSCKVVLDLLHGRSAQAVLDSRPVQRIHRHDESRGAKPALTAVRVGKAALNRVHLLLCAQTLHSHHLARLHGVQRGEAGVSRPVHDLVRIAVER